MICPKCRCKTLVLDKRINGKSNKRRRECVNGHRFNTYEIAETDLKSFQKLFEDYRNKQLNKLRAWRDG